MTDTFTLIAAPFTPLHADGRLWLDPLEGYARHLAATGVNGAFVCGSTGEGPSLSVAERKEVLAAWAAVRPTGFQLIAHVGDSALFQACDLARYAADLGYDAIAAVPPYYFRPGSVTDLVSVCEQIAKAAPDTPFMYYHIPILTHVVLSMPDFLREAQQRIPQFAGIKYTYQHMMDFNRCVQEGKPGTRLYWGRDEVLLAAVSLGANGAVGSTYNYMAPLYRQMLAAWASGDHAQAQALQEAAIRVIRLLDRFGGIGTGKAIMALKGMDMGPCRMPVHTLHAQEMALLEAALTDLGEGPWEEKI